MYNSYAAATDVVKDGENGVIIPKVKEDFCIDEAAKLLLNVATDNEYYKCLSNNAIETSMAYMPESIYKIWNELFEKMRKE
ncbi:MAG: hypothetical protein J6N21_16390 [Butyrivibrio sp.]|nr:hypothetical protein [Butyrivibrio sp.]